MNIQKPEVCYLIAASVLGMFQRLPSKEHALQMLHALRASEDVASATVCVEEAILQGKFYMDERCGRLFIQIISGDENAVSLLDETEADCGACGYDSAGDDSYDDEYDDVSYSNFDEERGDTGDDGAFSDIAHSSGSSPSGVHELDLFEDVHSGLGVVPTLA
jgi:hypothetical protein